MATLHHEFVEAPASTLGSGSRAKLLLVVHGIYGAGRNWGSAARRLVRARPDWRAVLVDLRSHGRSPRVRPHTVEACAADLLELESRLGGPADAVLGHSFGGKVALLHARMRSERGTRAIRSDPATRVSSAAATPALAAPATPALRQLWIVDSHPGAGAPSGGAWRMLGALRRHPGPFERRAEAVAAIQSEGFSLPMAQWMAINAVRTDDGLEWRLDADEMEAYLRDYFRTDAWEVVERPPAGTRLQFVRALASSVVSDAAAERIRAAGQRMRPSPVPAPADQTAARAEPVADAVDPAAPGVVLHELQGGHWLHVDNPGDLHRLLALELH